MTTTELDDFPTLTQRYQRELLAHCYRMSGSVHEAEDLVQETFLRAWKAAADFEGRSSVRTWLYRIATNAALMNRRARRRRPSESLDQYLPSFDAHGVHTGTPEQLQLASKADELLDRQVLAERARAVLARLPEMYRDPFVLRDLEELSTAEVAGMLGLEQAAVRQRVHRARLMLRGYLSELVGVRA